MVQIYNLHTKYCVYSIFIKSWKEMVSGIIKYTQVYDVYELVSSGESDNNRGKWGRSCWALNCNYAYTEVPKYVTILVLEYRYLYYN